MDRLTHLLFSVARDVNARLMPELQSGDAREAAFFLNQVLVRLAAEIGIYPEVAASLLPQYRATLAAAVEILDKYVDRGKAEPYRTAIGKLTAQGASPFQHQEAIRKLLGELIGDLAGLQGLAVPQEAEEKIETALADIARMEARWRDQAVKAATAQEPAATRALPSVQDLVNTTTMTQYLRRRFPDSPAIRAKDVVILPGGRSKKTLFISIEGTKELPRDLVMRQDAQMAFIKTTVLDEFPVLKSLTPTDLPAPRAYHLEPEDTDLGPPFILVERLPGQTLGDSFGFRESRPEAVRDLARVLGRLHGVDPRKLELRHADYDISPGERMRRQVEHAWTEWRRDTLEPSPVIECAFAWMYRRCDDRLGGPALVHGDMGAHNLLVDGNRITGILDWEFVSVGDPAMDLAYCRPAVEQVLDWSEFYDLYRGAGGPSISDQRLHFFQMWGSLRNAWLTANGMRAFIEGTADCSLGMATYMSIPIFENRLAQMLADS